MTKQLLMMSMQDLKVLNLPGTSTSTYSYFVDELINCLLLDPCHRRGYTEARATSLIYRGGSPVYSPDTMMQQVVDDVINDPGNYNDNNITFLSNNYALTIKAF